LQNSFDAMGYDDLLRALVDFAKERQTEETFSLAISFWNQAA
jgi:hypothetical protein